MPKISCIMPVYNTVDYLEETIESILNQSYTDFEFIISDDGSTDGSKDIIKKYAKKDKRIIFLDNKENRGIVDNLNDMLKISKGKYIAIMESDDISYKDRFKIEMKEFNKDKELSLLGSWAKTIDSNGKIIGKIHKPKNFIDIKRDILKYSTFINPSVIIKKAIIEKLGGYLKENDFIQDYDLFCRIIFSGYKGRNISEYLIKYRIHESSSSKNSKMLAKKVFNYKKYIIKNFNLKVNIKIKFIIYLDFIVTYYIPRYYKYLLERLYKKLFYNE